MPGNPRRPIGVPEGESASEECTGVAALRWRNGAGAVRVLDVAGDAVAGDAVVLERLGPTLPEAVTDDGIVTLVLCSAIDRGAPPSPDRAGCGLPVVAAMDAGAGVVHGPAMGDGTRFAGELLAADHRPVLLHGDVHHENVLDGGPRGWVLIDPKGVLGNRAFDDVALFTNGTLEQAVEHVDRRLSIVTARSGTDPDPTTMLRWVHVGSALSAVRHLQDGHPDRADHPLMVMDLGRRRPGDRRVPPAGIDLRRVTGSPVTALPRPD